MSMGEFYAMSQDWDCIYDTWGDGGSCPRKKQKAIKIQRVTKEELDKSIKIYHKYGLCYEDCIWSCRTEKGLQEVKISEMTNSHLINLAKLMPKKIEQTLGSYKTYIRVLDELQRRKINIDEFLIKEDDE